MSRAGARANKKPANKGSRLNIRVAPHQKDVITRAARLRQTSLSNFILERSYEAAQQILGEQVHFALSPDRWERFCAALDAPPKDIPALGKLLTEPSIFDEPRRSR